MTRDQIEQRLREIEERVNKATPGPWRACTWDPMEPPHVTLPLPAGAVCHRQYDLPRRREDAEFIAHAREDVPWLLSLLREREEENRRLREALEKIKVHPAGYAGDGHAGGPSYCRECQRMRTIATAALRGEQP